MPSLFKGKDKKSNKNDQDADVEAGEKDELLEDKKESKGDELEEVKVVSGDEAAGEATDEKKDPEKSDKPYQKYLNQVSNQAQEARNVCQQKYNALDRPKQLAVKAVLAGLALLLFILLLVGICTPSDWTNYARISEDGKYVSTHTTCGPVQG